MNIEGVGMLSGMGFPIQPQKEAPNKSGFDALWEKIDHLQHTQQEADTKIEAVLTGKSDDTHGALIALEKAELQLQLASVIRDKFTQGYQQIMNMQI